MEKGQVEVVVTDEFLEWYEELVENDSEAIYHYVGLLEAKGTNLGYPYCSAIKKTHYPIRELRVQSRGKPLRVFYAFDPRRNAVLILGGDKTGNKKFYMEYVPKVERIWSEYLAEYATGSGSVD